MSEVNPILTSPAEVKLILLSLMFPLAPPPPPAAASLPPVISAKAHK